MADNSKSKKKGVFLLLGAFLLAGGGVFLFFIIQGADDLKGDKNKNFSYGNVIREGVSPFFKFLGMTDNDEGSALAFKERMKGRGVEIADASSVDVSDWMTPAAGGGAAAVAAKGGGRSASASAPTSVPRMNGGGRGGLPGGGGASKSSGGTSGFSGSSGGSGTRVTAGQTGQGGAESAKGTLGALRNSQSMLSAGLRSGSAMTAKSKWDRSFGLGTTSGRGGSSGSMAYDKGGLVGLDKIKSGEITDLKTSGGVSGANAPAASMPKLEDDGKKSTGDPLADSVKAVAQKSMGDALNGAVKGLTGTASDGNRSVAGNTPPVDVKSLTEKPSPNGPYCPNGCTGTGETGKKYTYKDTAVTYENYSGVWTAKYEGEQVYPDGTKVSYSDIMVVTPGGEPELTCIRSVENGKTVFSGSEGYKAGYEDKYK